MAEAFATWESARCGDDGAPPSISVSHTFGPALCATPEYNPDGGNANLLIFRSDRWPYTSKGHELAATRLTVDDEGVIYDADIEINAATATLTLPGETAAEEMREEMSEEVAYGVIPGNYDLLSILIHEAGHFLGLDHSREENSLMLAELDPGHARTQLTPDDVAAICEVYPPDRSARTCEPSPRGGFSSACDETPLLGGCSLSPPAADRGGGFGLFLLATLGVAWRIGRSRR